MAGSRALAARRSDILEYCTPKWCLAFFGASENGLLGKANKEPPFTFL